MRKGLVLATHFLLSREMQCATKSHGHAVCHETLDLVRAQRGHV